VQIFLQPAVFWHPVSIKRDCEIINNKNILQNLHAYYIYKKISLMKKIFLYAIGLMLLASSCLTGKTENPRKSYALIPVPVSLTELKGEFVFTPASRIILASADADSRIAAEDLARLVSNPTGYKIEITEGTSSKNGSVFMKLDTAVRNAEGYELAVTSKKIVILARSAAGLFYAVQSLRQLMPAEVEKAKTVEGFSLTVPACVIKDEPRFAYRGMHLDVSRHFFSADDVKRYIDIMAHGSSQDEYLSLAPYR